MSFDSLLVANRGEVARRVVRAAREMGLRVAVVYVDVDRDGPAIEEADLAIRLETGYLDGPALVEAARRAGVEAVHPGYGFLSESADFARRVSEAGLVFVGPPADLIAAMGDKVAAKAAAVAAGVPVLPSTEDPDEADALGWPLLVKATGGGGGKGMRVVHGPDELADALASARREAAGAFGDERLFLERYVAASRHVEVQILGDHHGHLLHLGERECSIQRRHQKLVEESPSPGLDPVAREALAGHALTLARSLHYTSLGTVEFLVDDTSGEHYFLEVNTRLQVEHPVTEEVYGVDLVREQIRIAQGHPLSLTTPPTPRGWAIEVRLCAEDPAAGHLPAAGRLDAFEPSPSAPARWESSVRAGSVVGTGFDPMIAKVVAHGPTREEAARRLASALEGLHTGGVRTNRDLLGATLRHEAFLSGDTTTDFLERVAPPARLELSSVERRWALAAATLWLQGRHRREDPVWGWAPANWRNARLPLSRATWRLEEEELTVAYRALRDGAFEVDGERAVLHGWTEGSIDVELAGWRRVGRVTYAEPALHLQVPRGTLSLEAVARFAPPRAAEREGGLHAPMPGVVTAVHVGPGDSVAKGQALVVMEAMKMEHVITAPAEGVVAAVMVSPGDQVLRGADLLTLDREEG